MGVLTNIRFALQRSRGRASATCPHLGFIRDVEPGSTGCGPCLAIGDTWVHLRMCMTCGTVGCCDSSKNRHASRHAAAVGHPIARSIEPGEDWLWCFVDQTLVDAR